MNKRQHEFGVVSLLTVIFFMIFISLIVVGFMAIVATDQRQTTDNDLSSSALAAARSGIEDGKRLLLYCTANPTTSGCSEILNSQNDCTALDITKPAHSLAKDTLAIPINDNGEGATGGATDYQQYFTCLTIQTKTPSLTATLTSDSSYLQKLKTVSQFNTLQVEWSGTGTYLNRPTSGLDYWQTLSSWNSSSYMPALRLQFIPYKSADFADSNSLNTLEQNTRTVYVVPCGGLMPCSGTNSTIHIDARTASGLIRGSDIAPIVYGQCTILPGTYSCKTALTGYDTSQYAYYIRAKSIYSDTTLKLVAQNGASVVNFDGVQPWIDVTGRTSDVFKRVRAEVSYQPTALLPEDALTSAAPICKLMTVTTDASSSTFDCPE